MRIPPRLLTFFLVFSFAVSAVAQELSKEMAADIDKAVAGVLAATGAPSASIAVVNGGKLSYARAYGSADLEKGTAATPAMRYSIGSVSKQFTAAAVLLLAEEGKLSLDDKVVRWLPDLTGARDVTIRHLLSMTSGYSDFWPQDYVMPGMLKPATPEEIVNEWARKPLDFAPGTKWQYSNTNYVVAGMIIERVAGKPLLQFLRERIFEPLGMTSVYDTDSAALPEGEPARTMRYALGPLRPAPKEGKGWMFAAGELAMTATDLAKWNIAMLERKILTPESWRELEREMQHESGVGTRYGLGVGVSIADGRRVIAHGGEVSGFTARNAVYPEQGVAITALSNLDATNATEQIATEIAGLVFASKGSGADAALQQVKEIFAGLQRGKIDRSLFTSNANAYFSEQALKDFSSSLRPLGKPVEFVQLSVSQRGGMTSRSYRVKFPKKTLRIRTFALPDGKLEQYTVAAAE